VPKQLFEECARFSLAMARRHLGQQATREAYRRSHPIIWPGVPVPIRLAADVVQLPWKGNPSNPRAYTERLRLQCPRCWRPVLVLYGVPGDMAPQALGCRRCLGLVYYSQHCSGNRWYEHVVKPMRRLNRVKTKLAGRLCHDTRQRLEQEQVRLLETITAWQARLQPQHRRRYRLPPRSCPRGRAGGAPLSRKRPYRSLQYV
jgi:hypothetical protein